MNFAFLILIFIGYFSYTRPNPITYEQVRGTSYNVSCDHRAITINGVRTMLISGAIHYARSTPGGMSNNTSQNMALNEKSRYQENTFCY